MNWKRFFLGVAAASLLVLGCYIGREIGCLLIIASLSLVAFLSLPQGS